jgi:hypothetical protein
MRDFVPEHLCRICYRVVAPGVKCVSCTRSYEPQRQYVLDSIRWFTDVRRYW